MVTQKKKKKTIYTVKIFKLNLMGLLKVAKWINFTLWRLNDSRLIWLLEVKQNSIFRNTSADRLKKISKMLWE